MKTSKHYLLPLAIAVATASPALRAQPVPVDLDITIQVIEEGQTPDGFINRIELPPPEFFLQQDSDALVPEAAISVQLEDNAAELLEQLNETAADNIREIISIDGTGPLDDDDVAEPVIDVITELPDTIIDVLDSDLPLTDTLTDTVNDSLDNLTDQIPAVTDGIVDGISDTLDDGTEIVDDIIDDNLTDDNPVDGITDTVSDSVNGAVSGSLDAATVIDELMIVPLDQQDVDSGIDDLLDQQDFDDTTDDLLDQQGLDDTTEDLLEQTSDDITDLVPGI